MLDVRRKYLTRQYMKRNLRMSSSIRPNEICSGPRWEFAVKREMSLSELKMLAMANRASAISVGCHISHSSLGREELYWRKETILGKEDDQRQGQRTQKGPREKGSQERRRDTWKCRVQAFTESEK